jgi:hypothetical protein
MKHPDIGPKKRQDWPGARWVGEGIVIGGGGGATGETDDEDSEETNPFDGNDVMYILNIG